MKRMDWILIFAMLLLAGLLFLLSLRSGGELTAVISVAGEETARIPLGGTHERLIETEGGQNRLLLEPDGVTMQWATCHTQDCVHTGKITRAGQVIACLPHRVMVRLEGAAREGDVDAVIG